MSKPKEGDVLTYIPSNIRVTVVHVPPYNDVNDQHAIITVKMNSGHTMPIPVSKIDKFLTTEPLEKPVKFNPGVSRK